MMFSVIVAVFNGEKYIKRCISHFLATKSIDMEVIVVDDGSTDGTLSELKCFATDERLVVISQSNQGVSRARNKGLDNCHGDWVYFCDADDWVNADSFERVIHKISMVNDDCSVCIIGSSFVFSNRTEIHRTEFQLMTNELFLQGARFRLASWNYFFRMSNIRSRYIRFPDDIICAEDQNFNLKCICCSPLICSFDDVVYNYNQTNINSASKKKHHDKWIKSRLLAVDDLIRFCEQNRIDIKILKNQVERIYESYLYDFTTDISLKEKQNFYLIQYRKIVKQYPILLSKMKFKIGALCFPMCNLLFYLHKKIKG